MRNLIQAEIILAYRPIDVLPMARIRRTLIHLFTMVLSAACLAEVGRLSSERTWVLLCIMATHFFMAKN